MNATISRANVTRAYCAAVLKRVFANAARATANQAGWAMIVRVGRRTLHAFLRRAEKYVRDMAIANAAHANAKRPPMDGIRVASARNAQPALADAMNSRNAFNARSTKLDRWAIIRSCVQKPARTLCQKVLKHSK